MTPLALRWFRTTLGVVLAATLAFPPAALAAEGAVNLSGRVFQPDGTTPLQGATVRVIGQESGKAFESPPTDAAGHYEFRDLPPGTYSIEVEVPDGVYKLSRTVRIGQNDTASISFTVRPEPVAEGSPPPAPPEGQPEKKRRKGVLFALIVGGAALAFVASDNGGGQEASPFTPGS